MSPPPLRRKFPGCRRAAHRLPPGYPRRFPLKVAVPEVLPVSNVRKGGLLFRRETLQILPNRSPAKSMSENKEPARPEARLPKGLFDTSAAEIRATERMLATIRQVFESYGFEPLDTPAIEYTDALGKFLPDQDRPNEGVFSFKERRRAVAVAPLRPDCAARPLCRRELPEPAQALPPLSGRAGLAQREAGARPLPPIHPVRRRHGRRLVRRGGRRALHARRRHAGGTRHSARAICGEGQHPQGSRRRVGARSALRRSTAKRLAVLARHRQARSSRDRGVSRRCWVRAARTRFGDFTKGAELEGRPDRVPILSMLKHDRRAEVDSRTRSGRRATERRKLPRSTNVASSSSAGYGKIESRSTRPSCVAWNITPAQCSRPSCWRR